MIEKYKNIDGWFDWQEFYNYVVEKCEVGDTIVELGCWKGRSFCYLLEALSENNKNCNCYAVDTWTGFAQPGFGIAPVGQMFNEFQSNIDNAGFKLVENYQAIIGDSTESASKFENNSVRVLFIDDDHAWEKVKANIQAWMPKMKDDWCIIAGHDYPVPKITELIDNLYPKRKLFISSTPGPLTYSTFAILLKNKEQQDWDTL